MTRIRYGLTATIPRCPIGNAPAAHLDTPGVEVLENVANVDQCASGVGYPYDERNFTVCVEDVA